VLTSSRSLNRASKTAELPRVAGLRDLYDAGVLPRSGQLITVFGQPGSGKSTFTNWFVDTMDVPALIFSADMDAQDAVSRQGAVRTGLSVDTVAGFISDDDEMVEYIHDALASSKIVWCFDSGPTLQDIQDELDAYVELFDAYPRVIVVDNAMNVEAETEDAQGGLKFVFGEMHRLAHETGISVFLLHHAREEGDPTLPPGRDKLQGKVAQLPEIILGVALDQERQLFHIAPVKNRSGKADPTGNTYVTLHADPVYASFRAYQAPQYAISYAGRTESW
jgi:adenylate kinase family enzyme